MQCKMRQAVESPASTASIPFSLTLLSFHPGYFILQFPAVYTKADVRLEQINPITHLSPALNPSIY